MAKTIDVNKLIKRTYRDNFHSVDPFYPRFSDKVIIKFSAQKENVSNLVEAIFKSLAYQMERDSSLVVHNKIKRRLAKHFDITVKELISVIKYFQEKGYLIYTQHLGEQCLLINPKYAYNASEYINYFDKVLNYALLNTYGNSMPEYALQQADFLIQQTGDSKMAA